jgi:hypothetical protein
MTDAERMECIEAWSSGSWGDRLGEVIRICVAIEKAVAEPEPAPEPVAWVDNLGRPQPHCVTDLKYCSVMQHELKQHLEFIPLYAHPPKAEPQPARKVGGSYQADGFIVARFRTRAGVERVVFEFEQPAGMLHIFAADQVEAKT